jgi:hypothetical protein
MVQRLDCRDESASLLLLFCVAKRFTFVPISIIFSVFFNFQHRIIKNKMFLCLGLHSTHKFKFGWELSRPVSRAREPIIHIKKRPLFAERTVSPRTQRDHD